jgi:hypothetical protein
MWACMLSSQCNFEVFLHASKIYKFGLQLFLLSILGFKPFVQSNKLDVQCMDVGQEVTLRCFNVLCISKYLQKESETLKKPTPNKSLQFQLITIDVLPLC